MLNLTFRHEKGAPERTFKNKQYESQVRAADFHLSLCRGSIWQLATRTTQPLACSSPDSGVGKMKKQ